MAVLATKLLGATLAAAFMSLAAAGSPDEYDYVIIGSGPGGGSLAYVACPDLVCQDLIYEDFTNRTC